jgi:hypothetical protein
MENTSFGALRIQRWLTLPEIHRQNVEVKKNRRLKTLTDKMLKEKILNGTKHRMEKTLTGT